MLKNLNEEVIFYLNKEGAQVISRKKLNILLSIIHSLIGHRKKVKLC